MKLEAGHWQRRWASTPWRAAPQAAGAGCRAALVHVRREDLSHEVIPVPDDLSTATWTSVKLPPEYTSLSRGMQEDAKGHLWVAALSQGLHANGAHVVDPETHAWISSADWRGPIRIRT